MRFSIAWKPEMLPGRPFPSRRRLAVEGDCMMHTPCVSTRIRGYDDR